MAAVSPAGPAPMMIAVPCFIVRCFMQLLWIPDWMLAQGSRHRRRRTAAGSSHKQHESWVWPQPSRVGSDVFARFCRNPAWWLERLHVCSLPSLGALDNVELHGLTFLQALETTRVDCRVMHEDVFTVLTRNKAKALRIVKPLHSTLFHFSRVSWI